MKYTKYSINELRKWLKQHQNKSYEGLELDFTEDFLKSLELEEDEIKKREPKKIERQKEKT